MKRLLSTILALTLVVSMLAACGGGDDSTPSSANGDNTAATSSNGGGSTESGSDERAPITMAVVLRDSELSPADVQIYQELEAETGVMIDWQDAPEAGWEEKRALLFASNDLPDAFFGNEILTDEDVLKYGSQGMLIPLEDYITPELMPNLSKVFEDYPDIRKAATAPDGHIYSIPSYDYGITTSTTRVHYINQEWLDAVGMEVPTTMDEFYQVLKAFKENDVNGNGDPNDEIPFSFALKDYASDFFGSWGIIDIYRSHIDVTDGQVYYTAVTDEYKQAIMFFNKLFKEGLADQESFTQDSKAFKAKLKSEERIVGSFQSWRSTGWATDGKTDDYVPVAPLVGPNGDQLYPERINGVKFKGSFSITYSAEDPEYIMAWLDNIFDPWFGLQTSFASKEGVHLADTDGDGRFEYILDGNRENRTGIVPQGRERIDNVTAEGAAMLSEKPKHMIEKNMLDEYYAPYYKDEYFPKVFFSIEEVERLSILKTDIIGYTNEMYAKWMQVGGIEEEWDAYVAKLHEMGLEELVQIHQDALDRYNE